VRFCRDAYEAADGADALVLLTEWNEFKHLDLARIRASMARPIVVDGRNVYDPDEMQALGFHYQGIGRGTPNGENVHGTRPAQVSAAV
jgi:UDPglucose 6-dehydrogenase